MPLAQGCLHIAAKSNVISRLDVYCHVEHRVCRSAAAIDSGGVLQAEDPRVILAVWISGAVATCATMVAAAATYYVLK